MILRLCSYDKKKTIEINKIEIQSCWKAAKDIHQLDQYSPGGKADIWWASWPGIICNSRTGTYDSSQVCTSTAFAGILIPSSKCRHPPWPNALFPAYEFTSHAVRSSQYYYPFIQSVSGRLRDLLSSLCYHRWRIGWPSKRLSHASRLISGISLKTSSDLVCQI